MSKQSQFEFQCTKSGMNKTVVESLWNVLKNYPEEILSSNPKEVCFQLCWEAKKLGVTLKRTQAHELVASFLGLKNRQVLAGQKDKSLSLESKLQSVVAQIDALIKKGNSCYTKTETGYEKRIKFDNSYSSDDFKIDALLEQAHDIGEKLKTRFINNIPVQERKYYKICLLRHGLRNYITILTNETDLNQVLANYFQKNKVPSDMVLCPMEPIVEISQDEYENFKLELPVY